MYTYLLVILEEGAVPFCYYSNPAYNSLAEPVFMPQATFESVIRFAGENGLFINFLFGKHRLPREYEDLIDAVSHVKIIPPALKDTYPDGVMVLEAGEREVLSGLGDNFQRNIILRVDKNDLAQLPDTFASLQGKFKRLNIHLVGLEAFTAQDLETYEKQLRNIGKLLEQRYLNGEEVEVNVLSDRLLLSRMNNCDAGVTHLTVAPNGKYYICPAFYHDNAERAVGTFGPESELDFPNRQLLGIKCAPICSRCDAFQCKRCVYLNQLTTLEINTPSQQQCVAAHIERDGSRKLLASLRTTKPFNRMAPIPGLTYRDPFTAIVRDRWDQPAAATGPNEITPSSDCLAEIYEMQKKILRKLDID